MKWGLYVYVLYKLAKNMNQIGKEGGRRRKKEQECKVEGGKWVKRKEREADIERKSYLMEPVTEDSLLDGHWSSWIVDVR